MKYSPLVFLAAFFALAASWCGFVLAPQVQLGRSMQETNMVVQTEMYPEERPGLARQGLEVYRENGCAYCHTEQLQQKGTLVNVVLTDLGKTSNSVVDVLKDQHLGTFTSASLAEGLPKPVLS